MFGQATTGTTQATQTLNYNPKSETVDVAANYEKALTSAPENAGLISIEHNGIRKKEAVAPVSKYPNLDQYDFIITAQGQVFPKDQLKKTKQNDGLNTITARGMTASTVRICMIGGLPDNSAFDVTASFFERFTTQQFDAAIRLITSLLKKYHSLIMVH